MDTFPLPEPFPDDDFEHRSRRRRRRDQLAMVRQRRHLTATSVVERPDPGLDLLETRRRESCGPRLAFERVLRSSDGRPTLVVTNEVLVTLGSGDPHTDFSMVDAEMSRAGFVHLDRFEHESCCPELDRRVRRYARSGHGDRGTLALAEVWGVQRSAFSTSVLALHQPPPGPITLPKGPQRPVVKATATPSPTRISRRRSLRAAGRRRPEGGFVIAVIDTGIRPGLRRDGWLNDVRRGFGIDPLDALPRPNGHLDLAAGHGTFVAGVVRQVDPDVEIRVYNPVDSDGLASEWEIACAMIRAARDGADVISMSLGIQTSDDNPPVVLQQAVEVIKEMDRPGKARPVLVASAGNFGTTVRVWPGAFADVISVAALTAEGRPTTWSSHGEWVDCSTVGEGIVSTFVPGLEDPRFGGTDRHRDPAWAVWSGTSFAAPQIAGAISRVARQEGISVEEAADRLIEQGEPILDHGRAVKILPGT